MWKHCRWRDGNVVSAENDFDLGRQCGKPPNGCLIRREIGDRIVKPYLSWIIRVAREQQAVLAVEQRDRIRRVPWRCDDFYYSVTQIQAIATVFVGRDLP